MPRRSRTSVTARTPRSPIRSSLPCAAPELRAKAAQADKTLAAATQAVKELQTDKQALEKTLKDATAKTDKALKEAADYQTALASVDKLLNNAGIKDGGIKGVAQLVNAKKGVEAKLDDVNKLLAEGKINDPGAKGVKELLDARAKLAADRDDLDKAIKTAYAELVKAQVAPAGGDPAQGADRGRKSRACQGRVAAGAAAGAAGLHPGGSRTGRGSACCHGSRYRLPRGRPGAAAAREPFIQTPAQKLDLYAALLRDGNLNDPKALAAIEREADWVQTGDKNSAPASRAKALYVTGLALRNEGKFDAARKALAGAVKHAGAKDAAWQKQAQAALDQLTDARGLITYRRSSGCRPPATATPPLPRRTGPSRRCPATASCWRRVVCCGLRRCVPRAS